MRKEYWSNTKFADFIRGIEKPKAATMQEWNKWDAVSKTLSPFRFWMAEELLDNIQKAIYYIPDKISEAMYYINNRWVMKSHALTAHKNDIKPGEWQDLGDRFLLCLFNELVDYVEIRMAYKTIYSEKAKMERFKPPFWATISRLKLWRSAEAGLDYLDWESKLVNDDDWFKDDPEYMKPSKQALDASEVLELYNWWKNIRPNRPDPHEASGWTNYCKDKEYCMFNIETSDEERAIQREMLEKMRKMEEQYCTEDTDMLVRLIKIRQALW